MTLRPYVVRCTFDGCSEPARFKVAAHWSDGSTHELKTYGLACLEHVAAIFFRAQVSRSHCRLTDGESLEAPGIYVLQREARGRELIRASELESTIETTAIKNQRDA